MIFFIYDAIIPVIKFGRTSAKKYLRYQLGETRNAMLFLD